MGLGAVLLLASCVHAAPDDLSISTQVKIELLADPVLGAQRLDVSTLNGVVTVTGTVRSQDDRDRVVAAAKRVAGVRAVTANVTIYQSSVMTRARGIPSAANAAG